MAAQTSSDAAEGQVQCWCCGAHRSPDAVVHLGNHPEVALCFRCAHFVHRQARGCEDAARPSPAAQLRGVMRMGRRVVMRRGWHRKKIIGSLLRRLGRRLP